VTLARRTSAFLINTPLQQGDGRPGKQLNGFHRFVSHPLCFGRIREISVKPIFLPSGLTVSAACYARRLAKKPAPYPAHRHVGAALRETPDDAPNKVSIKPGQPQTRKAA